MSKPAEIYDREPVWDELVQCMGKPGPDLVFVLGRRRAGKSFLLSRFVRQAGGIYYQATARTENEQLLRWRREYAASYWWANASGVSLIRPTCGR